MEVRMILILNSAVYFLFCMMGISCLSSLGSKSTLKSQGGRSGSLGLLYLSFCVGEK